MHQTHEPRNLVERRKKPSREHLYKQYRQPTIQSWIQKLATTLVLQQTTPEWKIHTKGQQNTEKLLNAWKIKWQARKNLHTNWETEQQRKRKNYYNTNT